MTGRSCSPGEVSMAKTVCKGLLAAIAVVVFLPVTVAAQAVQRDPVLVPPPYTAEIVTDVDVATAVVATENVALVAPAPIVTLSYPGGV